MALVVLATVCFLACVFLLFVLFEWTRDSKRKTTNRTAVNDSAGETDEKKLQIVSPRRASKRGIAFREAHAGSRVWENGRGIAGLEAASANELLTRKSPDR